MTFAGENDRPSDASDMHPSVVTISSDNIDFYADILTRDEWNLLQTLSTSTKRDGFELFVITAGSDLKRLGNIETGDRSYSLNIPPESRLLYVTKNEEGNTEVRAILNPNSTWVNASAIVKADILDVQLPVPGERYTAVQ